jgi:hypothetical protein
LEGFPMNKWRIATMMMLTLMVLALMACEGATPPGPGSPFAYPMFTEFVEET